MPKNIVICCDGTSNEFDGDRTNVVKLYQMLSHDPARRVQTIEDLRFRLRNALPPPGRTPLLQPKQRPTPAAGTPITGQSPSGLGPRSPSALTQSGATVAQPAPSNTRRWVIVVIAIIFATLGNLAIAIAF